MIVLGIDPGLASTGFGVVASQRGRLVALDGGVIHTAAGDRPEARLTQIHARISEVVAAHSIDAVALEDLFFGQNSSSAFAVGQARGVAVLAAGQADLPTCSYTPQQVKQAVCGSGRATKDQVATMVKALLGLPDDPLPDHATDALAVAVCHANHAPIHAAMAVAR